MWTEGAKHIMKVFNDLKTLLFEPAIAIQLELLRLKGPACLAVDRPLRQHGFCSRQAYRSGQIRS
jgi:hypothetical protein